MRAAVVRVRIKEAAMRSHPLSRLFSFHCLAVVLATGLLPTMAQAQILAYDPPSKTFFDTGGGNYVLSITAPAGTGAYGAFAQFLGTGSTPIPSSWVTLFPPGFSFSTTPTQPDTQVCIVTVSVPPGTPAGTYTGKVLAQPFAFFVGGGDGGNISVVITGQDNLPPTLNLPAFVKAEATGA